MCRIMVAFLMLAAPIAASADAGNCSPSSYAQLRPPKYPAHAVTERIEGEVLVEVVVEADGSPDHLEVRKSSGNAELDQAALGSVAEWRFTPMRCAGIAKRAKIVVPVEFSLAGYVSDSADDKSTTKGVPRIQIVNDREPLEFSSIAEVLQFLRRDPAIQEHRMAHGLLYIRASDARTWEVFESFDSPFPAEPNRLIFRHRWLNSTTLLTAALCGATPTWCDQQMASRMAYMERNPPPRPPPPAAPK